MKEKIKTQAEVLHLVEELRQSGKKIVVYNGSFDVMHAGHVEVLERAKSCGGALIILVNTDASVKRYKGPYRPIVPEQERAEMVAGLGCVDYVTLFDEITPKRLLGELKPDEYCSGPAWGKDCVERPVVEAYGGQVVELPMRGNLSTSNILKKIAETYAVSAPRAVFIDRDGVINDNGAGYTHKKEDFIFLPRVVEALKRLAQTDYKIIIFTSQSGIARGMYTEADMHALHECMRAELARHGARIDKIYYCPHHPEITGDCECRKPKPGMLLRAADELGLSLNDSWVVGDGDRDVLAGREANARTIKVAGPMKPDSLVRAHHEVGDLWEAVEVILGESEDAVDTAGGYNAWSFIVRKYRTLARRLVGAAVRRRETRRYVNAIKTLFFLLAFPVEFLGDILFFMRRIRQEQPPSNIRRILISKPDQMGDVLFTTFLLPNIAAAFPMAEIHYLIHEKTAPILAGNPHIKKLHFLGQFSIGVLLGRGSGVLGTLAANIRQGIETIKCLRAERFDVIVNARAYPPCNNWFLALARPRFLISFDIAHGSFFSHAWAPYDVCAAEAENMAALCEVITPRFERGGTAGITGANVEFYGCADLKETAQKALALGGPDIERERYVVISPVTFDAERCVPLETWDAVIRYLAEDMRVAVVLTAIPAHRAYVEELAARAGYPAARVFVATAFSLPELAALMRGAAAALTIDSFPAFLAVAVGTPTLDFFNEELWFVKGLSPEKTFLEARALIPVGSALRAVLPRTAAPESAIASVGAILKAV